MNLAWLRPLVIRSRHWIIKNAPHILMGVGTATSVSAVVYAVKATPAAMQAIKDAEFDKTAGELPEEGRTAGIFKKDIVHLTPSEVIKVCAKYYGPAAGMEVLSLLCFWFAHGIDIRRQTVLAGLCSSLETALNEYQKKVVEMIGEPAEKEIRTAVAQDHTDRNPPPSWVIDSSANQWCLYKGYWFPSSYYKLKDIQNEANAEMIRNMYLSENDLLWMFDPEHQYIVPDPDSRMVGYCVDRLMEFDILPTFAPNHEPAMEIVIRDKDGREYIPVAGYSASL